MKKLRSLMGRLTFLESLAYLSKAARLEFHNELVETEEYYAQKRKSQPKLASGG